MATDNQADILKDLENSARRLDEETKYRNTLIWEAYNAGAAVTDIAYAAMVRSRTTIYNILKRLDR